MRNCTGAAALVSLGEAAAVLGWPERTLSDNAKAFRDVLADALAELGVNARHSRPYHPQTNGKVERFHLTLKKWLARQPAAATLEELQEQLDAFRFIYNHQRPHRSIGREVPARVWADAPKSGPADQPITGPTLVTTSKVHRGVAKATNRCSISVGAAHNAKTAVIAITGLRAHVFVDGRLVRELTIDPNRNLQRLYPRSGRPPRQLP